MPEFESIVFLCLEECCGECVAVLFEKRNSSKEERLVVVLLMTLFHSFTFANAQGTDLRTGTVAISCSPHTLSPFSPF